MFSTNIQYVDDDPACYGLSAYARLHFKLTNFVVSHLDVDLTKNQVYPQQTVVSFFFHQFNFICFDYNNV